MDKLVFLSFRLKEILLFFIHFGICIYSTVEFLIIYPETHYAISFQRYSVSTLKLLNTKEV